MARCSSDAEAEPVELHALAREDESSMGHPSRSGWRHRAGARAACPRDMIQVPTVSTPSWSHPIARARGHLQGGPRWIATIMELRPKDPGMHGGTSSTRA